MQDAGGAIFTPLSTQHSALSTQHFTLSGICLLLALKVPAVPPNPFTPPRPTDETTNHPSPTPHPVIHVSPHCMLRGADVCFDCLHAGLHIPSLLTPDC